jgi:hypothetical protein
VPVGKTPIIQDLQQHVEHVLVRLLYLIQQYYRVRLAPYRLGQITTFVVAT